MRSDGLQRLKPADDRLKSQMISICKYIKYVWIKTEKISSFVRLKAEDQGFTDITGDFAHHFECIFNSYFPTLTASYCATSKLWSAPIILADAVIMMVAKSD
jgi:hypothetical protein